MTTTSTLIRIRDCDPNGGETRPTPEDHRRHEEWARATFGDAAWRAYSTWGTSEDTPYDPSADDDIPGAAFHLDGWRG